MKLWLLLAVVFFATGCNKQTKPKAGATASGGSAPAAQAPAPTPQEVRAEQAVKLLNRASDLMSGIRDRASATAAAPELKTIAAQLLELNRQGVPLGSQVQENPQALGRFRTDMEKAVQRYADLAVRMVSQEQVLGPEFQDALRELGKLPR
jgi:hypothetical protein